MPVRSVRQSERTVRFFGLLILAVAIVAGFLVLGDIAQQTSETSPETQEPRATPVEIVVPPTREEIDRLAEKGIIVEPDKPLPRGSELVTLPPVRDVTPETLTQGPQVTGLTMRLPGPPPPVPKPRKRRFFRVVVADAGTIKAKKLTIKLAGVKAPDIKKVCVDAKNRKWRCGLAARGALRRLIRIRAIECPSMPFEPNATITVRCSVGRTDIAEWLVRYGWAEPAEDDEKLAEALEKAKADKRGMWR